MGLACAAVGLALALGACTAPPAPAPIAAGPATGGAAFFHCPPAGSLVETSIGETITWLGAERADPEVCVMRYSSRPGPPARMPNGSFVAGTQDEPVLRRRMREFLAFAPGKSATANVENFGAGQQWRITRTGLSEQRLAAPAGSFDTWAAEQVEAG